MNRFDYSRIPPHMMESLRDYIDQGVPPGDFLLAVLTNNLSEACGRADDINIQLLPVYSAWLYNEAPAGCWGSPDQVLAWMEKRRTARDLT